MHAQFTHLTEDGELTMVDVGGKPETQRVAVARSEILLSPATMALLEAKALPKGDVLATAKIAGILAAKKTADLIPLCHPLHLSHVDLRFQADRDLNRICIESEVRCADRTGVEMEALTAVQVAALTIYDMCKAIQKDMVITACRLVYKAGGRSGVYLAPGETPPQCAAHAKP
ncbi:MAG TPA: cyclic pyranopterin monophosphate synthase MoaC [Desulfonatronum sp.]|nr:cyclic pyranopterin monophosphate synthase MoaC [Desulfonatronum sp.]